MDIALALLHVLALCACTGGLILIGHLASLHRAPARRGRT